MSIRILYPLVTPVPSDSNILPTYRPVEYVSGSVDVLPGNCVFIDMAMDPPKVICTYPYINYKFYSELLPETFVDTEGSLRMNTGEPVFWDERHDIEKEANPKSPWCHVTASFGSNHPLVWSSDKVKQIPLMKNDIEVALMGTKVDWGVGELKITTSLDTPPAVTIR
jgi:hypothetical protein